MVTQFDDGGVKVVYGESGSSEFPSEPDGVADRRFTQTIEDIAIFLSDQPIGKTINRLYWADPASNPNKWNDNKQDKNDSNFNGPNTKVGDKIPEYLLRSNGFQWNANALDIASAINQGSFLVIHRDHGDKNKWMYPHFDNFDVFSLNNKNLLPIV